MTSPTLFSICGRILRRKRLVARCWARFFRDHGRSQINRSISGYVISPHAERGKIKTYRACIQRDRVRAPLHDIRTWVKYIDTQYSRRAGTRGAIGHSPPRVPRASRLVLFSTRVKLTYSARTPAAIATTRILDACTYLLVRPRIPCITESRVRLVETHVPESTHKVRAYWSTVAGASWRINFDRDARVTYRNRGFDLYLCNDYVSLFVLLLVFVRLSDMRSVWFITNRFSNL